MLFGVFTPPRAAMITSTVTLLLCLSAARADSELRTPGTSRRYAPDDQSLSFSPYNWRVNAKTAETINPGAYVRFMFNGSFLHFTFNVAAMVSPPSEVYWRVDNGPMTPSLVLPSVSVTLPPNNTFGDVPFHTVELLIKSTTERANRWTPTENSTRVILTGIHTDGVLSPWMASDWSVLIYGDSITEGVLTLGSSQASDTDHNDASVVYSSALGPLLGSEVGVVGFGATGLSKGGSGNVPALGDSWDYLWEGVPRSFLPRPDLIVFNEGTNDGTADIVAPMTKVLNGLQMACPGVPIAVLQPFSEPFRTYQTDNLRAAIAASGKPHLTHFVNTTGFYDSAYGGSVHPTGPNDIARVAPRIARELRGLLARSVALRGSRVVA
jgi:lysophospholipase L1-like esterase